LIIDIVQNINNLRSISGLKLALRLGAKVMIIEKKAGGQILNQFVCLVSLYRVRIIGGKEDVLLISSQFIL